MPVRSNRYFQVIATYTRRPMFRVLAAIIAVFCLGMVARHHDQEPWWMRRRNYLFFVEFALGVVPVPLLIALIAALIGHVRQQLDNSRSALAPRYIKPHLVVAACVFTGLCVAATTSVYTKYDWLPGVLAVVLTLMVVSAWASAFRSSWFSLLLVPIFIVALFMNRHTELLVNHIMDGGRYFASDRVIDLKMDWIGPTTVALILVDVTILVMLGHHLAHLSAAPSDQSFTQRLKRVTSAAVNAWQSSKPLPRARPHQMIHGILRRAWHRRVPAITPGAPWWMAAAIAGLISIFYLIFGSSVMKGGLRSYSPELSIPVLFATIVPAVAVAITWRERYNSLGYESLFPVRRGEFSMELVLAMAVDLAEYWLAAILATLLPQVCFSIAVFNNNAFSLEVNAPPILASVMMQFLSLGTIFWISRQRSFMAVGSAIIGLLLATTIPFQLSWADPHPLAPTTLLMIAGIEMVVGLALTAGGYFAWRNGELA